MSTFKLKNIDNALIFGAGHGIGAALVQATLERNSKTQIFATYRNKERASELFELQKNHTTRLKIYQVDPLQENELESLYKEMKEQSITLGLIINSIGTLHNAQGMRPEKSLRSIKLENLTTAFQVNAAITPLIAKFFHKLLSDKSLTSFVTLSAKVGSIKDNRMGGWYAYRASKAALNMFIKNIALEFQRSNKTTIVSSIHPGTTITQLSEPYIQKTNLKLHSPLESAQNILNVIEARSIEDSGNFYSWDGAALPW